jgi:hypothetical protein
LQEAAFGALIVHLERRLTAIKAEYMDLSAVEQRPRRDAVKSGAGRDGERPTLIEQGNMTGCVMPD